MKTTMRMRVLWIGAATVSLSTVGLFADRVGETGTRLFSSDRASSMLNASRDEAKPTTPKQLIGKWTYGSVGSMTYWETDTGKFLGNARGSAGMITFDDAGGYKQYMYLEMRTYSLVTKVFTTHEGVVRFDGNTMSLTPTKGHYYSESGSRKVDRDMTDEELKKNASTYQWELTKDDDGVEHFVLPFEDGSKFDYKRDKTE